MQHRARFAFFATVALAAFACEAGNDPTGGGGSTSSGPSAGSGGGISGCGTCDFLVFTPCTTDGSPGETIVCEKDCDPTLGCVECAPGSTGCVGNDVVECADDGTATGPVVETCDTGAGYTCSNGACKTGCEVAVDQPSNVGCEFWAVDLDQQDGFNDPASADWGVTLSNPSGFTANVTIEINTAPVGQTPVLETVAQQSVPPGALAGIILPIRELDCGTVPNDYDSPGTCLSSRAFRITSSTPIIVYQFNVFENAYSNDASLLLPKSALGQTHRVIGWGAGHPVDIGFPGVGVDRSYITVVGTEPGTQVTVHPSWKIKGNDPIAATAAGGEIVVTLGPFDVLNLETDDGSLSDDPKTIADLSGSYVTSTKPVAVFSGVESTAAPGAWGNEPGFPTYPGWDDPKNGGDSCCLDHLEEQLFPAESVGTNYAITRSPVRSSTGFREPDVIRFVGVAEVANITTSLPAPFNAFTLQPGEVRTTWAQNDFIASGDKPFIVGQLQISQGYVDGQLLGDPSLTVFPPVEQFRSEYVIPTPGSWTENWVVISAEVGTGVTLDGNPTTSCVTEVTGTVNNKSYESRRCPLEQGVHQLLGDAPFGIIAYGYGSAGSYAFAGGAFVKKIYEPPVIE